MESLVERLRRAQQKDVDEQRLLERLSACGVDPDQAAAAIIGGQFALSDAAKEGLRDNGLKLPCTC